MKKLFLWMLTLNMEANNINYTYFNFFKFTNLKFFLEKHLNMSI